MLILQKKDAPLISVGNRTSQQPSGLFSIEVGCTFNTVYLNHLYVKKIMGKRFVIRLQWLLVEMLHVGARFQKQEFKEEVESSLERVCQVKSGLRGGILETEKKGKAMIQIPLTKDYFTLIDLP
jgi:hypothetical protein